jgi:hypothetical protein
MAASAATRLEKLSPQELQVARIAARGQNNIEGSRSLIRIPKDRRGVSDEGLPQARDSLAHRAGPDPAEQQHRRLTRQRTWCVLPM